MIHSGVSSTPPTLERPYLVDSGFSSPEATAQSQEQEIINCIHALSDLAAVLNTLSNDPSTTLPQTISFHKKRGEIEHRLLSMHPPDPTTSVGPVPYSKNPISHSAPHFQQHTTPEINSKILILPPVYEAARLALLLCINHTFRHFNSHSPVFQTLLTQLTKIIAQITELQMLCHTTAYSQREMEMMLWVGFVAGIFAREQEKKWFGQ